MKSSIGTSLASAALLSACAGGPSEPLLDGEIRREAGVEARIALEDAGCIACHAPPASLASQLAPIDAPRLDAVGRPRPLAFAKHLLTRPSSIAKLPSVAGAFNTAERRLRQLIATAARA